MSMFVGFLSMGDCAHTVTSRPAGTVKISSGTRRGGSAAIEAEEETAAAATPNARERMTDFKRMEFMMPLSDLERIGRDVGVDQRLLAFLAGLRIAVLHAEHAVEPLRTDVAEQILVVHFPGARLFAPGVVADLEVHDLAPGVIDVRDDVAFVALH